VLVRLRQPGQPGDRQRCPGQHHRQRAEAPHQPRRAPERHRRHGERHRQEREAGLQRAEATDALEVERAGEERPEPAGHDQAAYGAGADQGPHSEDPQREHRVADARLPGEEAGEQAEPAPP
jgi:hypothetical protein